MAREPMTYDEMKRRWEHMTGEQRQLVMDFQTAKRMSRLGVAESYPDLFPPAAVSVSREDGHDA